ncbi:MarR family winged helix-turn-helix transcriptional regulator [Pseudonocardia endophytica]|uniref:DNA-binding MarR family transcriptional regulator n=1 Tax=Pseudonocardia endophytica TaxID=401976 RepID=A0A4R1IAQ7_PSEEN|nr:MarR family transcriptional regulator [Pseudonocardia endophytica]TCK27442.1 DNA-binding MarR family transcriptional regulator [Pseudonocardia endophytica]
MSIDAGPSVEATGTEPGGADLELADDVVRELFLLVRQVKRSAERHRPEMVVDMAGYHVLVYLNVEGPQRAGELAAAFHSDPSTVSRQVAGLVKAGLVERRADPGDGRASILAATDEGVRVIETERRRRARVIAAVLGGWSAEDRAALTGLLARFRDDYQSFEDQGERS